jgi:DNA-binding NarL/FixJ family response regulator
VPSSEQAPRIRVFLAEDNELLRAGLQVLISAHEDMEVVGEANDGAASVTAVLACLPDIVIMDVSLPSLSGPAATKRLRIECPSVKVLGLSAHVGRDYIDEMLDAGAWGYVVKQRAADDLVDAIRQVVRGERYVAGQRPPPR